MCYNELEVIGMIVVFGGAFNPVTKAHLKVYQFINEKLNPKSFMFLPVSSVYSKSNLIENNHRYEMLRLATKQFKNVIVSDLELNDQEFLGTYQSLLRIKELYHDEIVFVVGADNIIGMERWIRVEDFLTEFKVVVLNRNQIDVNELIDSNKVLKRFKSSFIIFKDFEVTLSSTQFRDTMNQELVPKEVYEYIQDNKLYRGEDDV